MQIEEGKCYRTRHGRKAGPMRFENSGNTPWAGEINPGAMDCLFHPDGRRYTSMNEPWTDLVAEWTEAEATSQPQPDLPPLCENCRWWANLSTAFGSCHAKPPTVAPDSGQTSWPMTHETDWCGEFAVSQARVDEVIARTQIADSDIPF